MKRVILLIFNFLYFINPVYSEKIEWKIQDTLSYSSLTSLSFSDNGDTLVANNGEHLIFLDAKTGEEIKRLNSRSLFLISDDYCFGVTSNKDTNYVVSTYTGDTISYFLRVKLDKLTSFQKLVFSHDSKLIIQSVSFSEWAPPSTINHAKSQGLINIINTETGDLIKTILNFHDDSLGKVDYIFFDRTDFNKLYFTSHYLNVDDSNDVVIKRVYLYDIEQNRLDTLINEYSESDEYSEWLQPFEIFPASPYGCAIDVSDMQIKFYILGYYGKNYTVEEGLNVKSFIIMDFTNFIILHQDLFSEKIKLSRFIARSYMNSYWIDTFNSRLIDTFESGYIKLAVNSIRNLIAVSSNSNVIMYSDSLKSDIDEINKSVFISPNPASDYIEINVPRWRWGEHHSAMFTVDKQDNMTGIRIFDLLGVEQLPRPDGHPFILEGEVLRIDVSSLPPGVYFLRAGNEVRKFVKI